MSSISWRGPFDHFPDELGVADPIVNTVLTALAAQVERPEPGTNYWLIAQVELEDTKPGRYSLTCAVFYEERPEISEAKARAAKRERYARLNLPDPYPEEPADA